MIYIFSLLFLDMTSIQIIVERIKNVYAIKKTYASGSYYFIEPLDIDMNNLAEFACSVSLNLGLENWFLDAKKNYFVLEIEDKYIIVYFADDRTDNATEFVIRRCNNYDEYLHLVSII